MKKLITLPLVLLMALSLAACGGGKNYSKIDDALQGTWVAEDDEMSFKLIFNNGTITAQTYFFGELAREVSGTYEIEDGVISFNYDKGDIDDTTVAEISYTLNGNNLQIGNFEKESAVEETDPSTDTIEDSAVTGEEIAEPAIESITENDTREEASLNDMVDNPIEESPIVAEPVANEDIQVPTEEASMVAIPAETQNDENNINDINAVAQEPVLDNNIEEQTPLSDPPIDTTTEVAETPVDNTTTVEENNISIPVEEDQQSNLNTPVSEAPIVQNEAEEEISPFANPASSEAISLTTPELSQVSQPDNNATEVKEEGPLQSTTLNVGDVVIPDSLDQNYGVLDGTMAIDAA